MLPTDNNCIPFISSMMSKQNLLFVEYFCVKYAVSLPLIRIQMLDIMGRAHLHDFEHDSPSQMSHNDFTGTL